MASRKRARVTESSGAPEPWMPYLPRALPHLPILSFHDVEAAMYFGPRPSPTQLITTSVHAPTAVQVCANTRPPFFALPSASQAIIAAHTAYVAAQRGGVHVPAVLEFNRRYAGVVDDEEGEGEDAHAPTRVYTPLSDLERLCLDLHAAVPAHACGVRAAHTCVCEDLNLLQHWPWPPALDLNSIASNDTWRPRVMRETAATADRFMGVVAGKADHPLLSLPLPLLHHAFRLDAECSTVQVMQRRIQDMKAALTRLGVACFEPRHMCALLRGIPMKEVPAGTDGSGAGLEPLGQMDTMLMDDEWILTEATRAADAVLVFAQPV